MAVLAWWAMSAVAAASEGRLLEGDLGRWLDSVAPELGTTLSRHPRFSGETMRLVTLTPGAADGRSNRLAQALERRLRERLLEFEGVRLAVDRTRRDCEPPQQIGYLVRIEVTHAGGREGRVHIAVVDVAESVWVSGISHQWQGRLSAAERAALDAPLNRANPGTPGSPIPVDNADDVAAAMKAELACSLPRNLAGGLFVATPEPRALARVGLALQSELMFEPLAALTPDRDQARWLLTLDAEEKGEEAGDAGAAGADVREVNLTLTDTDGGNRQRVASVFVSGSLGTADSAVPPAVAVTPRPASAPTAPPASAPTTPPAPAPSAQSEPLLSALEMRPAPPEGICDARKARMNSCVEVFFELSEPAYLLVMSTRGHGVVEAPCDTALRRAEPGPRRYRMRVPPGTFAVDSADTGPDAGFYVLASRSRQVAEQLRAALAGAPGRCVPAGGRTSPGWLGELGRVLDRHGDRVAWRAMHLAHDSVGIVPL